MSSFILVILLVFSVFFILYYIELERYEEKTNKSIKYLIKRMKMYEHNQNCIFDEIININNKGVHCYKKGKNCK